MAENQYENFKRGIKNDVNNAALGIFYTGGFLLLILVMLCGLIWVLKDGNMNMFYRIAIGGGISALGIFMCINHTFLKLILGVWLIIILIAVCAPVLIIMAYTLYQIIKEPLNSN